jgi:hypothetical protein
MRWLKHPVCPGATTIRLPPDAVVQSVRVNSVTTSHTASQQSNPMPRSDAEVMRTLEKLTRSGGIIVNDLEASIGAAERLSEAGAGAVVVENAVLDPRLLAAAALVEADVDKVGNLADGKSGGGVGSSGDAGGREGEGQERGGELHGCDGGSLSLGLSEVVQMNVSEGWCFREGYRCPFYMHLERVSEHRREEAEGVRCALS